MTITRPVLIAVGHLRPSGVFSCARYVAFHVLLIASSAVLLFAGVHAEAAILADLQLVVDGSADPPGDRLNISVYLLPGEEQIELQVRGYAVSGRDGSQTASIRAARQDNRDPEGRFRLVRTFRRRPGEMGVEAVLVVPYGHLDLPLGNHQIAYEVTGLCRGEVAFVRATPLTAVQITSAPRQHMVVRRLVDRQEQGQRRRVYLPGERGRGEKSEPDARELEITKSSRVVEQQELAVSVPGGFIRSEVVPPKPAPAGGQVPDASHLDRWKHLPWYPLAEIQPDACDRIVHFATTRAPAPAPPDAARPAPLRFGTERSGAVTYGAAVVNFPVQHHRKGNIELPGWWGGRSPEKCFCVESLVELSRTDFLRDVRPGDVLLYVHGHKNTLDDALLRAAQLKYDLEFPGAAVAFSWPSDAGLSQDEYRRVAATVPDHAAGLAEVLHELTSNTATSPQPPGKRRVHVIAHSLGNRLLLEAIWQLVPDGKYRGNNKYFGQVVLAAPDVGAIQFNNLIPYVVAFSEQITYYYCQNDVALKTSREINRYEPVGLLPYFDRGLDTVNADGANTSFLGHAYFASSEEVLLDIQLMVNNGFGPEKRMPPLASRSQVFGHDHWSFTPMQAVEVARRE
jgi:esterase/lipase superfamily enzyme